MYRTLHSKSKAKNKMQTGYTQAKIQTLDLEGIRTAYRRVGVSEGTPILFLNHLAANMDGADPMGIVQRVIVSSPWELIASSTTRRRTIWSTCPRWTTSSTASAAQSSSAR